MFQLLLVWFYSVLTVREHILIANGSKIMAWWLTHHYLAIALSLVMLTWCVHPVWSPRCRPARPSSSVTYQTFHTQFMAFSLYLGGPAARLAGDHAAQASCR